MGGLCYDTTINKTFVVPIDISYRQTMKVLVRGEEVDSHGYSHTFLSHDMWQGKCFL